MTTPPDQSTTTDFDRGYRAAMQYAASITQPGNPVDGGAVLAGLTADSGPGPVGQQFSAGWRWFCNEVTRENPQQQPKPAAKRGRRLTLLAVKLITMLALVAVLLLTAAYGGLFYLQRQNAAPSASRPVEQAPEGMYLELNKGDTLTRWIGAPITTSQGGGAQVTRHNGSIEIGLRSDGSVVWRPAPPTAKAK